MTACDVKMETALKELLEDIRADYIKSFSDPVKTPHSKRMIDEFCEGLEIEYGRKYIKILTKNSIWGFIMREDDGKFRKGDILKAASRSAPARNAPRGNILDGGYVINWTGPLYL